MSVSTSCSFYCGLGYLIREKPLSLKIIFFLPLSLDFCILGFLPPEGRSEAAGWALCVHGLDAFLQSREVIQRGEQRQGRFIGCFFWSSAVITAAPGVSTGIVPTCASERGWRWVQGGCSRGGAVLPEEKHCARQGSDGQNSRRSWQDPHGVELLSLYSPPCPFLVQDFEQNSWSLEVQSASAVKKSKQLMADDSSCWWAAQPLLQWGIWVECHYRNMFQKLQSSQPAHIL